MGGQFTAQDTVNMPANVIAHACGSSLAAALITEWSCIINCHVKVVGGKVSVHGIRVGLAADASVCGFLADVIMIEEVR